ALTNIPQQPDMRAIARTRFLGIGVESLDDLPLPIKVSGASPQPRLVRMGVLILYIKVDTGVRVIFRQTETNVTAVCFGVETCFLKCHPMGRIGLVCLVSTDSTRGFYMAVYCVRIGETPLVI